MQEKVITIPASVQERPILRVAAYCRVSSDSGDQLHSFAAQVQHYTHFINNNERSYSRNPTKIRDCFWGVIP